MHAEELVVILDVASSDSFRFRGFAVDGVELQRLAGGAIDDTLFVGGWRSRRR